MTIGADRPPKGTRQRRFAPFRSHESGSPVSIELPLPLGPRASGQSPKATRRAAVPSDFEGPWPHAGTVAARLTHNATTRPDTFSIGFWMLLEYVAAEKAAYER